MNKLNETYFAPSMRYVSLDLRGAILQTSKISTPDSTSSSVIGAFPSGIESSIGYTDGGGNETTFTW